MLRHYLRKGHRPRIFQAHITEGKVQHHIVVSGVLVLLQNGSDFLFNSDASVGTEELAHMEMIAAIVRQLTRNMTIEDVKKAGFDTYFVDHTGGIWPQAASGMPFSSMVFQSKGDAITDLFEDLAAEQKARTTYDNILRLVDIPDVREPIKFLRQREITHFQRFGEALRMIQEDMDCKNFYAINPSFDNPSK